MRLRLTTRAHRDGPGSELTVLLFWQEYATFAGFIDVKREVVDFADTAQGYDRAQALFEVGTSAGLPTRYVLTPAEPRGGCESYKVKRHRN
jgi:hypothetical protein